MDDGTGLPSSRLDEELGTPAKSHSTKGRGVPSGAPDLARSASHSTKGRGSQPGFQSGDPDMACKAGKLVTALCESL